ncbi:MAG: hypothetical protein ACRCZ0_07510 [Cetobacterium sp.]
MTNKKLILSEDEFREYLLDKYVDGFGQKLPIRQVWETDDFMNYTGMFKINKYTGKKERCSEGTMSYYNKKLGVTELDIFEYHQRITKRIPVTTTFSEWSRKHNKGYTREEVLNQDTIKRRMIKHFDLSETYYHFSPNKVRELSERLFGKEEMTKFYEVVVNG